MRNISKWCKLQAKNVRTKTNKNEEKQDFVAIPTKRARQSVDIETLKMKRQKRKSRKFISNIVSLNPALRPNELVWARIRGYTNWPGVIERETSSGKYLIHFFGDYTKSEVTKAKITHLMEGFQQFSRMKAPTVLLQKSIRELSVFVREANLSSCPICDMLKA